MKLVINKCHGGFGVSAEALKRLIALDSKGVEVYDAKEYYGGNNPNFAHRDWRKDYEERLAKCDDAGDGYRKDSWGSTLYKDERVYSYDRDARTDPALISVVEEMGEAANGFCAKLTVVEIPDGVEYTVEEYDGSEWVAEAHRTWR